MERDWKAVGRTLAGLGLPVVGAQLAGPAGAAAGRKVSTALGLAEEPAVVAQAVAASDPATLLRLAEIEAEERAAGRADLQHARETHQGHPMTVILPVVLIAVWVYLTHRLLDGAIPADNRDLFNMGYGSWTTVTMGGVAYWLSSSAASAEKTSALIRRT